MLNYTSSIFFIFLYWSMSTLAQLVHPNFHVFYGCSLKVFLTLSAIFLGVFLQVSIIGVSMPMRYIVPCVFLWLSCILVYVDLCLVFGFLILHISTSRCPWYNCTIVDSKNETMYYLILHVHLEVEYASFSADF
jgi:hypothetical protein